MSAGTKVLRVLGACVIGAGLILAGCAPLVTQNPSQGWKPVNVKNIDGDERLLLDGHDVVSYFTENRHRRGDAAFKSVYKGVTLRFSSAQNKALFDKTPEAYLPQYGGYCANGIVYGIPWGGDGDSWRIIDGKLYMFGGAGSKKGFELDIPENIKLADKYWKEEVSGANAFYQRSKRMIFKVPHYKSGAELAALVAAKEKK
jgi:YHS domain-containing protein